jgi:nucleotidyltransferase substrate binding protein (TIGR01987 family)
MSPAPDIRWTQRFQSYGKALASLSDAVQLSRTRPLTELEKQGLIQAFEFTHELAWKTLKDFLESRGQSQIYGSKDATKEAFAQNLITDGESWMDMIAARNRSTHTYNQKTADEISEAILTTFIGLFVALNVKLAALAAQET